MDRHLKDDEIRILLKDKNPKNIAKIVDSMSKCVFKLAHCHSNVCSFEELRQAGFYGLMKAIEKFDETKTCKFSTYAYQCIRGYILNEINSYTKNQHINFQSMNDQFETDTYFGEEIKSNYFTVQEEQNKKDINDLLRLLKEKERKCIIHYYGLNGHKSMTFKEIGMSILNNYTPAGAKYMINRSIEKMYNNARN